MSRPHDAVETAPLRVLVCDDEKPVRDIMVLGMRQRGWQVDAAENGRQALRMLLQRDFDALVVDIFMDEMDGIAFIEEALRIWPWLGVVVVSGRLSPALAERVAGLGVAGVLAKPVLSATLCEHVQRAARRDAKLPDGTDGRELLRVCSDLRRLTRLGVQVIETRKNTLAEAVHDIAVSLCDPLPGDAIVVLVNESGRHVLHTETRRAVPPGFVAGAAAELVRRYRALTASTLEPEQVEQRVTGSALGEDTDARVEAMTAVPLVVGQEIRGMLAVASAAPQRHNSADVAFLYHAANHLSEVFVSLSRTRRLVNQDPLTSTLNRIGLDEELTRLWSVRLKEDEPMGIVVVDIDDFKLLNDSYGHAVGDAVLREFAAVTRAVCRSSDVLARYAGDEFVLVLPGTVERDARDMAERLLAAVAAAVFCGPSEQLRLTASAGVAVTQGPALPPTASALLAQADRALFSAKRAGGNRVCVWPPFPSVVERRHPASRDPARDHAGRGEGEPAPHIAVVDDEPHIRKFVEALLKGHGYQVTAFSEAKPAIQAVKGNPSAYQMLITDLYMPDMNGIELLKALGTTDDLIVKVVISGRATVEAAMDSVHQGAYDLLQKPFEPAELVAVVRRGLEHRELRVSNLRYQTHLEDLVRERSAQVAASLDQLKTSYQYTLEALVGMLDAREHETGQHDMRVRELAVILARRLRLPDGDIETVAQAALLHDIGKIGVPDGILLKRGPLTPEEWTVMKRHPEIGYNILEQCPYLRDAARIVLCHHEHFDGGGYPHGLSGERIPLGARLFAVIDAYDAMRSERPYRSARSAEDALRNITGSAGMNFDPTIVAALSDCVPELERAIARFVESANGGGGAPNCG